MVCRGVRETIVISDKGLKYGLPYTLSSKHNTRYLMIEGLCLHKWQGFINIEVQYNFVIIC